MTLLAPAAEHGVKSTKFCQILPSFAKFWAAGRRTSERRHRKLGGLLYEQGCCGALAATAAAVGVPSARGVGRGAIVGVKAPSGGHILQRASVDGVFKSCQRPTWVK